MWLYMYIYLHLPTKHIIRFIMRDIINCKQLRETLYLSNRMIKSDGPEGVNKKKLSSRQNLIMLRRKLMVKKKVE